MKYIIVVWVLLALFMIFIHIGKYVYFKELQKELQNKNEEQVLDYIYNTFKLK
jgi:hypothetical protein